MNKILVVCKIQDEILKKYASQIVYQPHLTEFSEHEWEELIISVKPKIILFGTIHFTREMTYSLLSIIWHLNLMTFIKSWAAILIFGRIFSW